MCRIPEEAAMRMSAARAERAARRVWPGVAVLLAALTVASLPAADAASVTPGCCGSCPAGR
jgi:hypothetical protein